VIIYGTFGGGSSVKASLAGDAPDLTGCSEYISYEGNVEKNFPSNTASNHSYLVNVNLGMTLDLDAAAAKQVNEVTSKVNSLSSTYKYWKVISSGENTLENWAPNYFTRTAVEVLDMSEALSITSLANNFFSVLSNIRKVTLPSNLTAVSDNAFQGRTSLTSVVLGEKVTTIGNYAFAGCSSLSAITLGDNVTILGDYAFASCTSLESITLSDNITAIGECTFAGCSSLSSVTFGENVTTIGKQAFSNCTSLGSITLGKNITTIEANAFAGCTSLGSITLGENITTIGANAFAGCSNLSSVTLGPNIQSIAASAFQDKSIKTVTLDRIPASVLAETLNKQLFTPYVSTIIGYISDADGEDAMSTYATGINNVFYIISQVGYPTVYVDKYVDALQTNLGSAFTVRSIDEYTE
jgi:hypothetical protein